MSVSLKDERFNRLLLTCAVTLYHFDDVASFLDKFQHVTNQLACIVRCFLDLEFLKVMLCIGALFGVHLVEPFFDIDNIYCNDIFQTYSCFSTALT